jgi:hypothetical protein
VGTKTNCGGLDRVLEARPRAHALVHGGGGAVDRDLHALHVERGDAVGRAVVDAARVGLELDGDPGRRQPVENVERMRHGERLAAAKGDVGNAGVDDAFGEVERLIARQLVAPRLVRAGLLAAGEATRAAAVGELPGEKKGRVVLEYRAPLHCGNRLLHQDQVKRMYGCAITCSETSSSLGFSHFCLAAGFCGLAVSAAALVASEVTIDSFILFPSL